MAGQTDRFGQPIPAAPGYQTILNPDGSQPQMRNVLYLGTGLTATDNPNSEATNINVDVSILGGLQTVDGVTNLRNDLFLLGPDPDKVYVTKYYYVSSDTGAMAYRWDAADTTTDDGVLHIKNSHHSTGRFQPIKPADGMINAQACGPALADVGTITRSFDPTGTRSMHTETKRISTILRNAGWSGIVIGRDKNGAGDYKCSGSEEIGRSDAPWRPFWLRGVDGVRFFNDPSMTTVSVGLGIYMDFEGGPSILSVPYYTSRDWTQTIRGGENSFDNVANVVGLSVDDTIMVRLGADPTDTSGWCGSYYFGTISAVTPGTGTTGTVATNESCPEQQFANDGRNLHRTQGHNDMVKVTGFQDYTKVTGITFHNVFLALQAYRQLEVDGVWESVNGFAINGVCGIGMYCPRILIKKAYGSVVVPSNVITLAGQYDTHIVQLIVNDHRPLNSAICNIVTEELGCRHTTIGSADITWNAGSAASANVQFANQTAGQTDCIYVDHLTTRGGYNILIIGPQCYVNVLDDKCGLDHAIFIRPDQVKSIWYQGNLYRNERSYDYFLPISAGSHTLSFPIHGLTSGMRVRTTSMVGITAASVSGNGSTQIDIYADLVAAGANVWMDVNQAAVMSISGANYYGTSLTLTITSDGSSPLGTTFYSRHSVYEKDLVLSTTSDDSVPYQIVTNGAPTVNANFIGQDCFDSTNSVYYRSVATGTGASDWKPAGAGGAIPDGTSLLGSLLETNVVAPSTPAAGKAYIYVDSTTKHLSCKPDTGLVSVTVAPKSAVTSQWLNAMSTSGVFTAAQPSSIDLSDLAPVALTNADATITVAGGSYYSLAASTLTGLHTLTLGNTSASDKQAIQVRVFSQGSNYLINDSAASLLLSVASGTKVVATFVWSTGTGKFQLQSWNFFT